VDPVRESRLNLSFDHLVHRGHHLFQQLLAQVRDVVQAGQFEGLQGGLRACGEVIEKGLSRFHEPASDDPRE
jgi:hypothetical protein